MEIGFILMKFSLLFAKWATFPYRKLKSFLENKRTVTEVDNPLLLYSATDLARMIREKKVSNLMMIRSNTDD